MPFDFVSGNETFIHSGQEQMQVEVILASKPKYDTGAKPVYTIRLRYPRIIHGEIMTHRVFSRNARSSRAVPVKTMLLETTSIPFVPWHWGKNQKGMQAYVPLSPEEETRARRLWLDACDAAVEVVEQMMDPDGLNVHKQNPNRLLEPFSWIDVLITSCDWDNFLWVRDHKDAEPHLRDLARLVKKAIDAANVQELEPGEWHQPYITQQDRDAAAMRSDVDNVGRSEWLNKISAARCARISYKPFNGNSSYEAELERYDLLVTSERVHASPLEHQATPDGRGGACIDGEYFDTGWLNPTKHGNLTGYIQARKQVPGEYHTT